MKNKKEALTLLSNLLHAASIADKEHKEKSIREGKAARAIGEGWILYHLKVLENLIQEEEESNE